AIHATDEYPEDIESLQLKIKDMPKGQYTFSLIRIGDLANYNYFLLDRFVNKTIDMQETPEYVFQVTSDAASTAENRFELFFEKMGVDTPLSLDPVLNPEGARTFVDVFPNPATGKTTLTIVGKGVSEV